MHSIIEESVTARKEGKHFAGPLNSLKNRIEEVLGKADDSSMTTSFAPMDKALAEAIAPTLKENNILFVGLDVIGNKITEINITSPTCVREIEAAYDVNIMGALFDAIEKRLAK